MFLSIDSLKLLVSGGSVRKYLLLGQFPLATIGVGLRVLKSSLYKIRPVQILFYVTTNKAMCG
jgi:hypothetical protein